MPIINYDTFIVNRFDGKVAVIVISLLLMRCLSAYIDYYSLTVMCIMTVCCI